MDVPSSSRPVRIVVWVVTTVLAIIILAAGAPKLAGDQAMKEIFIDFGWPDPIYLLTGVAEVLGAIGLLVRQFRVAACAVLALVQTGAAITHIVVGSLELVSFNFILILTFGALAWHFAALEGRTVQEALATTGRATPRSSC